MIDFNYTAPELLPFRIQEVLDAPNEPHRIGGVVYVPEGGGTLTAEQVEEAVYRNCKFFEGGDVDAQELADELNGLLGSGTCVLDYDRHCSNCGVYVHESAVLIRKKLDGGLWTVVSKPASFCPNCGARIRKAVSR